MGAAGRSIEALQILHEGGPRLLAQRMARAASLRLHTSDLDFPLALDDIADSRALTLAMPEQRPLRGAPLTVGWICTPPGPGSGGHTTLFRMVEAVEAAGHTCVLYLYDRFRGLRSRHEQVIKKHWPGVRAAVRFVDDGLEPLDAYVASAWQTAHVLASRSSLATRRLYFIQDFEPYFYPMGSEQLLAEDSYRFGFRCIVVGRFVAEILESRFGAAITVAEHGCDTGMYRLTNSGPRSGVVFYAKPRVARRGFELGMLALREFHRRRPDQEIHIYGDARASMPFPVINHGTVSPASLSSLYNNCRVGLSMSFTNISLVPAEMLACGTVPVISGAGYRRADLDNPFLLFSEPSPSAIADNLCAVMASAEPSPKEVAASISASSWKSAQSVCVETIEDEVYGSP